METWGTTATSVRVWDGARVQLLRLRRQASAPETLDSADIKYLLRDCCVVLPACKTMQAGREREREGGRKGERERKRESADPQETLWGERRSERAGRVRKRGDGWKEEEGEERSPSISSPSSSSFLPPEGALFFTARVKGERERRERQVGGTLKRGEARAGWVQQQQLLLRAPADTRDSEESEKRKREGRETRRWRERRRGTESEGEREGEGERKRVNHPFCVCVHHWSLECNQVLA
jgi:hypothetical protein